jgi:hypothetical protein
MSNEGMPLRMFGKPILSLNGHLTAGMSIEERICRHMQKVLPVMGHLYRRQKKCCQHGKKTPAETIDLKKQMP